jgi:hypothetical protein
MELSKGPDSSCPHPRTEVSALFRSRTAKMDREGNVTLLRRLMVPSQCSLIPTTRLIIRRRFNFVSVSLPTQSRTTFVRAQYTWEPPFITLEHEHIPDDLKSANRWISWKSEWDCLCNRWTKIPVDGSGNHISANDRCHWSTYDEVRNRFDSAEYGIGFVLGLGEEGFNFAGINLDDSRNPVTLELSELAQSVLRRIRSYAEISPTGTGLKIFCYGKLPFNAWQGDQDQSVAIYDSNCFFAFTGEHVEGTPLEINDCDCELNWLWKARLNAFKSGPALFE